MDRQISPLLAIMMLLGWAVCSAGAQSTAQPPSSPAPAPGPEIKRLGGLELFVYVGGSGKILQVHFIQKPDSLPISYAEVTVRAFDEDHQEVEVKQSLPEAKNYQSPPDRSSQHTGFYRLSPEKDKRVRLVKVLAKARSRHSISPRKNLFADGTSPQR